MRLLAPRSLELRSEHRIDSKPVAVIYEKCIYVIVAAPLAFSVRAGGARRGMSNARLV